MAPVFKDCQGAGVQRHATIPPRLRLVDEDGGVPDADVPVAARQELARAEADMQGQLGESAHVRPVHFEFRYEPALPRDRTSLL